MLLMQPVREIRQREKTLGVAGEEGFTLLEVMIASVILAIALMAIATAEVTSVGTNRTSRGITQASAVAEEILERMRRNRDDLTSYNGIDTSDSTTRPGAGIARTDYDQWQARMISGGTGQVTVTADSPISDASLVTVTITWSDALPRTVTLQTTF